MPQLGEERIKAMFAELGLATDAERARYVDLARVGVVNVAEEETCRLAFFSDSPSTDPVSERDAELPQSP